MEPPDPTPETALFWDIAEPFLADPATSVDTLRRRGHRSPASDRTPPLRRARRQRPA
jgi:hypothetical protein